MAYDTEILFQQAIDAIEQHDPIFITELIKYLPCDPDTFYSHFPKDSDKFRVIRAKIDLFRVAKKSEMRKKWYESDSASLQICAYKLLADDNELNILTDVKKEIDNTKENPRLVTPAAPNGAISAVEV